MGPEGYKAITEDLADLKAASIEVDVTPQITGEGESAQYVTVSMGPRVSHATILNALREHVLIDGDNPKYGHVLPNDETVLLRPIDMSPGSITFLDRHYPRSK